MSWLKDLVAGGVSDIVRETGNALDSLITSDEERDAAKIKLQEIANRRTQSLLQSADAFEQEVTKRHANDMKSDSWLSKNIRPLSLAFLLGATVLLAYLTTFSELSARQAEVLAGWRPMLTGLLGTGFVFYFGSRGIEKVQKIRKG